MKNTISILGCGWLGLPLAIELSLKEYLIKGSTTSNDKLKALKSNDIQPFIINLSNREPIYDQFLNSEILIIAIPSKNINDFQYLISKIETSIIKKVLFISSTSVYPNNNSTITEESPTKKVPLTEIENLFNTNKKFKTTILRFGGLIGYNRKPGNFFKNGKVIDHPEGFVNLIHRDDCIQIIESIIEKEIWNETLNACTDTHPKRREFYTKEFKKEGRNSPLFNQTSTNDYKIVENNKLKKLLNYNFKHSDLMLY